MNIILNISEDLSVPESDNDWKNLTTAAMIDSVIENKEIQDSTEELKHSMQSKDPFHHCDVSIMQLVIRAACIKIARVAVEDKVEDADNVSDKLFVVLYFVIRLIDIIHKIVVNNAQRAASSCFCSTTFDSNHQGGIKIINFFLILNLHTFAICLPIFHFCFPLILTNCLYSNMNRESHPLLIQSPK